MTAKAGGAGFTLVEVLISLALFALIGLAGVALVESVIGVQERTHGRLDRIADIRRAHHLIGVDFDQAEPGDFAGAPDGVRFRRHGFGGRASIGVVRYSFANGTLLRQVDDGTPRALLDGVARVRWRYLEGGGWQPQWRSGAAEGRALPRGVDLELELADDAGQVRRVVALPTPL